MKLTDKRFGIWEIYNRITGWFHVALYRSSSHIGLPRHRQPLCVAMVDFIKGVSMLRIATDACADRFLRSWNQR